MKLLHHNIKKIEDLKPFVDDARLDKAIGCLVGDQNQTTIDTWKSDHADKLISLSSVSVQQFLDLMAAFYSGDENSEDALKQWAENYNSFKKTIKEGKKC